MMMHLGFLLLFGVYSTSVFSHVQEKHNNPSLAGVMLTVKKDQLTFEYSMLSALEHLKDIDQFFVITPDVQVLQNQYGALYGDRVRFIDESTFPFGFNDMAILKSKGNKGWYLQQLLKLYAGRVLNLTSYVMLDSDLIWYNDVHFFCHRIRSPSSSSMKSSLRPLCYTSSDQYTSLYYKLNQRLVSDGLPHVIPGDAHRSGIVHHMPIHQEILDHIFREAEVVLFQLESMSTGKNALSEFELYYQYARSRFPDTVIDRPLYFTNGPAPGLLCTATQYKQATSKASYKHGGLPGFRKQMFLDSLMGFDFVGYHNYAKRRYSEMRTVDIDRVCANVPAVNATATCAYSEDIMSAAFAASKYALPLEERVRHVMQGGAVPTDAQQLSRINHIKDDILGGCMCAILKLYKG